MASGRGVGEIGSPGRIPAGKAQYTWERLQQLQRIASRVLGDQLRWGSGFAGWA